MQEMMFQKHNVNFNDYPNFFKRGTFLRKNKYKGFIDDAIWNKIPEKSRPESRIVIRSKVESILLDKTFSKCSNRVDFIFNNSEATFYD